MTTYGGKTLDELRTLEAAATPAPWVSFADTDDPIYGVASVAGDRVIEVCREPESDERIADMAFIATMRNALPDLLNEIRRLQAWRETVINLYPDVEDVT